jgi:hypothetical protein
LPPKSLSSEEILDGEEFPGKCFRESNPWKGLAEGGSELPEINSFPRGLSGKPLLDVYRASANGDSELPRTVHRLPHANQKSKVCFKTGLI